MLEDDGPAFQQNYYDGYFLADPALFVKNHYPLEIESSLLENPPSFDEFIEGPVVYKDAFNHPIIPISPKKMHLETLKNESVSFHLLVPDNFQKANIKLVINGGGSDKKLLPKVTINENECALAYTFQKTGLFDVHIKVRDSLIATYVVRVKRK